MSTSIRGTALQLTTHGGALFCCGLIAGLVFTFVIIGRVEVWPFLPALDITFPGSEAGWRRAHLGLMFNAVTILVFAAMLLLVTLSERQRLIYAVCVLVTGWGNSAGFVIAAIFGGRGLAAGGEIANTVVYLCFLIAVPTAFTQAGLLIAGARKGLAER